MHVNLVMAWTWILLGFLSGSVLGLFFARENWLGGFASFHGADFYGLPRNTQKITLRKEEWQVAATVEFGGHRLVPLRALWPAWDASMIRGSASSVQDWPSWRSTISPEQTRSGATRAAYASAAF